MKRVGFYFINTDDDATSACPECGRFNTNNSALAVLECIKINQPMYVQCEDCKTLYNIGGDVEEGGRMTSTNDLANHLDLDTDYLLKNILGGTDK
ncbi:hypothetical protein [Listeria welshimeri]|uniref:hypothetical protein n=1 Tax=Listeria welshimeri TaxID=1643 RepID=UPI0016256066|nr:hypothetical protein [Listeria welshimeri]MBC1964700.1 hypothetical protein [Listeria welshimeri]MBF2450267.1 hypothetical protein [Listeria welshimeri]MBF2507785.1 hypothetical protein [Listeria welshimeri]MBF2696361.1 hypothetical protein [Listeria welshimeri]